MDIEQVHLAVTTSGKLKVSEYVHNINILSVFFAECSPKTFTLLFWERSIFKYLWNCREESLTFGGKYQIWDCMTEMSSDDLFHKRRHSKLSESADVFRKKIIFKEMYSVLLVSYTRIYYH